jgi:hypothetical protein
VLAVLVAETTDTPVWWLVAATFSLAAVGLIALLSLRDARKTRQTQLLVELSERWDSRPMIQSSVLFREFGGEKTTQLVEAIWGKDVVRPDPRDIAYWQRISIFPNLIEVIGVFVGRGMISPRIIYEMWGGNIIEEWARWEAPVLKLRELSRDDPIWLGQPEKLWQNFETLAAAMRWFLWAEQNGLQTSPRLRFWVYLSRTGG